jgi:hypothetical protein
MRHANSSLVQKVVGLAALFSAVGAAVLAPVAYAQFNPQHIMLKDPTGDDNGPGKYTYPTNAAYTKGSFDITKLEVHDRGDTVEFVVGVNADISDPWNSKGWPGGGNGWSIQFPQIYIDQDNKPRSGQAYALPGINATFAPSSYYEKVVLISPQGRSKLVSEINTKAKAFKKYIVIPDRAWAEGRELHAIVKVSELGGKPNATWGFQAVMQSNEGYADRGDLLTRKVNEYNGEHRFGGGNDGDCDPHVIDMLAGKAMGSADEVDAQHRALGGYKCGPTKLAVLPMVYPGK